MMPSEKMYYHKPSPPLSSGGMGLLYSVVCVVCDEVLWLGFIVLVLLTMGCLSVCTNFNKPLLMKLF